MRRIVRILALAAVAAIVILVVMPVGQCGSPLDYIIGGRPSLLARFCEPAIIQRMEVAVPLLVVALLATMLSVGLWAASLFSARAAGVDPLAAYLPLDAIAWLDQRAAVRAEVMGGEPDRAETLRLVLAYAAWHMPAGWEPPQE